MPPRQNVLEQVRRRGAHAPARARRAEPAPLTGSASPHTTGYEPDHPALLALPATLPREAGTEHAIPLRVSRSASLEVPPELLLRVLADPHLDRPVVDRPIERRGRCSRELAIWRRPSTLTRRGPWRCSSSPRRARRDGSSTDPPARSRSGSRAGCAEPRSVRRRGATGRRAWR